MWSITTIHDRCTLMSYSDSNKNSFITTYNDECAQIEVGDMKRCLLLKFGFKTIIGIHVETFYPSPLCLSMLNMFQTKILKPMFLSSNIPLPSTSEWGVRKTQYKISKNIEVLFWFNRHVKFTKRQLHS